MWHFCANPTNTTGNSAKFSTLWIWLKIDPLSTHMWLKPQILGKQGRCKSLISEWMETRQTFTVLRRTSSRGTNAIFFCASLCNWISVFPACLCLNPALMKQIFANVTCPAGHPTKTGDNCNLLRRPRLPLNYANHKTQWSERAKLYISQLDKNKNKNQWAVLGAMLSLVT